MENVTSLVNPAARERRRLITRLGLIAAAAHRLEQKTFDALSVRDVTDALSIPETAFYQYFGKKAELLGYITQLWQLELQLAAERAAQNRDGLAFISALFGQASRLFGSRPGLTKEVTAHVIRQRPEHTLPQLSALERQLAFPDFENAASTEPRSIPELFTHHLQCAIEHRQLPQHINLTATATALTSLLFGAASAPLTAMRGNPQIHQAQLNLFLVGMKSTRAVATADESNAPSLHHRHADRPPLRDGTQS